jgi:NitT/TauT family transport system ATP-binding protein
MPKIEVKDLAMIYHEGTANEVVALDGINLQVDENEFVAIVGPSGCGKSTLLYIVGGFLKASRGRVFKDNLAVTGPGPDRGIVFQHFALFDWKTVKGNILMALEQRGLSREAREEEAEHLIRLVNLVGFENKYPSQLSGGMKQRVAIARTLALDPEVLLMDEPFGALDAQTRRLMQEELLHIWSKRKKTVLFVTHDVREGVFLADRVVVMTAQPGKIKEMVEAKLPLHESVEETQEFNRLTQRIWGLVKEEVTKVAEKSEIR